MKKILVLLAVLIFSGCIAEAELDEATETNSETENSTELEELQGRLDSLEAIIGDTLVTDTLVTDTIDTSIECVEESFTITKQINKKTFTGCVELLTAIIYYKNGLLHREDGPAIEYADGSEEWYINGERHREDGPAAEWAYGGKQWYLNGVLHREDGPAFEWADGEKQWYLNGLLHREDGPAIEYADGRKQWYLNAEQLTEEEFNAAILNN